MSFYNSEMFVRQPYPTMIITMILPNYLNHVIIVPKKVVIHDVSQ
jgi:hypothetical protein